MQLNSFTKIMRTSCSLACGVLATIFVGGCVSAGFNLEAPEAEPTLQEGIAIESVEGVDRFREIVRAAKPPLAEFGTGNALPLKVNVRATATGAMTETQDSNEGGLFIITLGLWPAKSDQGECTFSVEVASPYGIERGEFTVSIVERAWILPLPLPGWFDKRSGIGFFDSPDDPEGLTVSQSVSRRGLLYKHSSVYPADLIREGYERTMASLLPRFEKQARVFGPKMARVRAMFEAEDWQGIIAACEGESPEGPFGRYVAEARQAMEKERVEAKLKELARLVAAGEWKDVAAKCEGEKGEEFTSYREKAATELERIRVEAKLERARRLAETGDWEALRDECKGETAAAFKPLRERAEKGLRTIAVGKRKAESSGRIASFADLVSGDKSRMQREEIWKRDYLGRAMLLKGVFKDADNVVVLTVGDVRIDLELNSNERPKVANLERGAEVWFSGIMSGWDYSSRRVSMRFGRLGDGDLRADMAPREVSTSPDRQRSRQENTTDAELLAIDDLMWQVQGEVDRRSREFESQLDGLKRDFDRQMRDAESQLDGAMRDLDRKMRNQMLDADRQMRKADRQFQNAIRNQNY